MKRGIGRSCHIMSVRAGPFVAVEKGPSLPGFLPLSSASRLPHRLTGSCHLLSAARPLFSAVLLTGPVAIHRYIHINMQALAQGVCICVCVCVCVSTHVCAKPHETCVQRPPY